LAISHRRQPHVIRSCHCILGYYGSPGAPSTLPQDTVSDRRYIVQEAQTLFRQNQQLTDQESIKKCLAGCEARIEIGLYYRNPYPRPIYLPIMGLATQKGGKLKAKQRMRKQAKPVYLQSHEDS
uniref:LYR motif containing 1 n=1 Tax=Salmo trutta TaxID=8032 RepID=A0A673Y4B5_SALTR